MKHLTDKLLSLVYRWLLLVALSQLGIVTCSAVERIVFQRQELSGEVYNLVIMDEDSDHPAELPTDPALTGSRMHPTLSPDMRILTFTAQTDGGHYRLFRWEIDENNIPVGTPTLVIPAATDKLWGDELFPAISNDGTLLAFLVEEGIGDYSLRMLDNTTGQLRLLRHVNVAAPLQWRTDDVSLLFLENVGEIQRLRQLFVDDSTLLPDTYFAGKNITSATYSPDGNHIAALLPAEDGTSSLEVTLTNGKTRIVLTRLINAKCVRWPHTGMLMFNASRVGEESGKALWSVAVDGTGLLGISGYTIPRLVSHFARRQLPADGFDFPVDKVQPLRLPSSVESITSNALSDSNTWITPISMRAQFNYTPPHDNTIYRKMPFIRQPRPQAVQLETRARLQPPTPPVLTGNVNFVTPLPDTEVRGAILITAYARRKVSQIILRIEGEVMGTLPVKVFNSEWGIINYTWNTQEWLNADLPSGQLPGKTHEQQHFPDGQYMLTLTALNMDGDIVGRDFVNVTVANELPAKLIPASLELSYPQDASTPDERYRVTAIGNLYGTPKAPAPGYAVFDIYYTRRALRAERGKGLRWQAQIETSPTGNALILRDGAKPMPEEGKQVLYLQSPEGVVTNDRNENIPPLTMLTVPFTGIDTQPFRIGMSWYDPMWVVADLYDRTTWKVPSKHQMDGVERIGGSYYARIRSEFSARLQPPTTIATTIPGFKIAPTSMESTTPTMRGIRYSWFDYTAHSFYKVEDYIVYDLPGGAHYTVRYTYLRQ